LSNSDIVRASEVGAHAHSNTYEHQILNSERNQPSIQR